MDLFGYVLSSLTASIAVSTDLKSKTENLKAMSEKAPTEPTNVTEPVETYGTESTGGKKMP